MRCSRRTRGGLLRLGLHGISPPGGPFFTRRGARRLYHGAPLLARRRGDPRSGLGATLGRPPAPDPVEARERTGDPSGRVPSQRDPEAPSGGSAGGRERLPRRVPTLSPRRDRPGPQGAGVRDVPPPAEARPAALRAPPGPALESGWRARRPGQSHRLLPPAAAPNALAGSPHRSGADRSGSAGPPHPQGGEAGRAGEDVRGARGTGLGVGPRPDSRRQASRDHPRWRRRLGLRLPRRPRAPRGDGNLSRITWWAAASARSSR